MQPVFREATIDDLPAIIGLLADDGLGRGRESPGLPLHPNYLRAFETIRSDPNQLLAVADRGGIIGCLQISFIPGLSRLGMLRGQIEGVRIAAGARGGGLGRQMSEWAIETCRRRGCGLVQTDVRHLANRRRPLLRLARLRAVPYRLQVTLD